MSFKILSLDGGASWALVQARVLQDLYDETGEIKGHELLRKFDMAVANSGGSVLLGLLCNNMSLKAIISFYTSPSELKKVFPALFPGERLLQQIIRIFFSVGAKYSTSRKLKELRNIFLQNDESYVRNKSSTPIGNTFLDKLPFLIGKNYRGKEVQLIIPAFDYFKQRVTFFRSDINSNTNQFIHKFYEITLVEAIHASCNAPVNYYDRPAKVNFNLYDNGSDDKDHFQSWFWDGAVAGFNNPVLAGLVEAVTNNPGLSYDEFQILSIGTGQSRKAVIIDDKTSTDPERKHKFKINSGKPFVEWKASFGFLNDIKKISSSILSDPPDSATFIAYSFMNRSLINQQSTLVRINPWLTPEIKNNIYDYPIVYNHNQKDRDDFLKLMKLDFDVFDEKSVHLIADMCDKFIVNDKLTASLKNQLIRGEINDTHYLGYRTYQEAKERWIALNKNDLGYSNVNKDWNK